MTIKDLNQEELREDLKEIQGPEEDVDFAVELEEMDELEE
jgi:hypothetical protein